LSFFVKHCLLMCFWLALSEHGLHAQDGQISVFSLNEGLPQSQVECLFEDHRGALWLGTEGGGAARFNGNTFSVINTSHGLPGNRISAIAESPDHIMWLGSDKGLAAYNGWQINVEDQHTRSKNIHALAFYKNNMLLVATDDSLFAFTTKHLKAELYAAIAQVDPMMDFMLHPNGELYACSSSGIYTIHCQNATLETTPFAVALPNIYGLKLILLPNDEIGLTTYGNGVFTVKNSNLVPYPCKLPDIVYDGIQRTDREMLFATQQNGVMVCKNDAVVFNYTRESGLPVDAIKCALRDRKGNVWLGTSGGGLVRLSQLPFQHVATRNGRLAEPVYALAEMADSTIYVAAGNRGIWQLKNNTLQQDSLIGDRLFKAKALFADSKNRLWIGTEGQGVFIKTKTTIHQLDAQSGISGAWVRAFAEDRQGNIWIGTAGGGITKLTERPDTSPEHPKFRSSILNQTNGLTANRITALAVDQQNNVWYATRDAGIGCILPTGRINNYPTEIQLPSNQVADLAIDHLGFIWVALSSGEVGRINTRKPENGFELITPPAGAPYALYAMEFDASGNLWLGSAYGAIRWQLDHQGAIQRVDHFTRADGFAGLEVCSAAIARGSSSRIFFGTMDGCSVWNADGSQPDAEMFLPNVVINQTQLFYRPLRELPQRHFVRDWEQPADTLVLTYQQNNLSFQMDAVHLTYPLDITYHHWLVGEERQWSPPTTNNRVSYSNLPPGEYRLRVKACVKGEHCTEARPVTLIILEPYWMTNGFKISLVAAVFISLIAAFWLILRTVKRRAKERNNRLRLERDVLEIEQRALRLQMNPHFIFNTLNSIQGVIAREDNKTARRALAQFAKLMRTILQNSREENISLEEEFETLKQYLELAQFTHENCFTFGFEANDDLLACEVPPLILQPFVENAILHGLVPKGGGEILVSAYRRDDQLLLTVEDNGVGMAREAAEPQAGHRSTGLEVTRERLSLFAEHSNGRASIEIESPESGGTRVILRLPISR
jgi:ligand-binding sensor domain-containing protein/two-component sensor histidine kinase